MSYPKNYFLICAIGWRWATAGYRLKRQILKVIPDSSVEIINIKKLEQSYPGAFRIANQNGGAAVPGYGYWVWKPIVVYDFFQKMSVNTNLFYIGAGCEINSNGLDRFSKYLEKLKLNSHLFFSLGDPLNEILNDELREFFKISMPLEAKNNVTSATCFGFSKIGITSPDILLEWYDIAINSPEKFGVGTFGQSKKFRHDQSILSAINYKRETEVLENEIDTEASKTQRSDYLFLALRNRMPFSTAPGTIGLQFRRTYWRVRKLWLNLF